MGASSCTINSMKFEQANILDKLPPDMCHHILSFVDVRDLCTCATVNKRFYGYANNNVLWKYLVKRDWGQDTPEVDNGCAHGTEAKDIHNISWKHTYKSIKEALCALDGKGIDPATVFLSNDGLSVKRIASGPWKTVFTKRSWNKGIHVFEVEVINCVKGDGFIFAGVKTSSSNLVKQRQWTYGNNGSVVRTHDSVVWTKELYGNGDIVGVKTNLDEMVATIYLNGKEVYRTDMKLAIAPGKPVEDDHNITYYFVVGFANFGSEFLVHTVPKYKYRSMP